MRLDSPDRSDRNELLTLVRVLQNAIATGNPATRKDHAGMTKTTPGEDFRFCVHSSGSADLND
jgi:hypothetical protein